MNMKKIKLFLGCFIAMTLLYACFDDEGNYDLSELATVGIQLSYTQPSIGEEYVIDPVIDYKGVDSTEFGYTWVCDIQDTWSDTICREKMLRYTFTEIANYRIRLVVEHVPTGALTTAGIYVGSRSRYSSGWTILSEQNNQSILSYIRVDEEEDNKIYTLFENIYTTFRGDELGTGPVRMGRHFSSESDQILVIQESGAVEIDGLDFSKAITTREEFIGGVYPAGFVPSQAEYASRLEAVLGTDGNVYTRINPNGNFQVCQYNTLPAFNNARITMMHYGAYQGYIYMYDELNHRMIGICDEPQAYTGMVINMKMDPDGVNSENFTPLDNMGEGTQVMFIGSYNVEGAGGRDFVQVIKKGSDYYFQTYKVFHSNGSSLMYAFDGTEELFVGNSEVNDDSKYCMDGTSYFYFTSNNILYYWNRVNRMEPFYTFQSKIIDIERYANGEDREEIGVGLENGEFYILDASYEAISGQKEKVLFKAEGLGRVVDVQYKYGNLSNFNKESRL